MQRILVFDNYDSFTYNLVQMIEQIVQHKIDVAKNDEISISDIEKYDKIILSPGPGIPSEAGNLLEVIKEYSSKKPIFGVCLGLQAITEVFGGSIINLNEIYHGVATEIEVIKSDSIVFKNIPKKFDGGRYHSWAANPKGFPNDLEITAVDQKGMVMALEHKNLPVYAVQFHPESVLTPLGKEMIRNFLLN